MKSRGIPVLAVAVLAALGFAWTGLARAAVQAPRPMSACPACKEKGALLDPATIGPSPFFGTKARAAYQAARLYPKTFDRMHCFCECEENPEHRHKTLLTCFTSKHGEGCGICIQEALMIAQLKKQGLSDVEVERWVEESFMLEGHPPTADPKP